MDTPAVTLPRRFTEAQAAQFLGVSQRTLQDWRTNARGPAFYKLSKRVVYDETDLQAYLARNRVETKEAA